MIKTRTSVRLIVSAIVFLFCAEVVALLWYAATTGTLFYETPREAQELEAMPADRLATDFAVHPYFGFAHIPNAGFHDERTELLARDGWPASEAAKSRTNNFGFISPHAYPLSKSRPNQFFVGIFGGSVGMWFCQVAAPRLIETLTQHPFFEAREIVPLCFSQSGYKQPQLAQVLGFFLSIGQPLDLVVNIDGFNDVALGGLNDARGLDVSLTAGIRKKGAARETCPESVQEMNTAFKAWRYCVVKRSEADWGNRPSEWQVREEIANIWTRENSNRRSRNNVGDSPHARTATAHLVGRTVHARCRVGSAPDPASARSCVDSTMAAT